MSEIEIRNLQSDCLVTACIYTKSAWIYGVKWPSISSTNLQHTNEEIHVYLQSQVHHLCGQALLACGCHVTDLVCTTANTTLPSSQYYYSTRKPAKAIREHRMVYIRNLFDQFERFLDIIPFYRKVDSCGNLWRHQRSHAHLPDTHIHTHTHTSGVL